MFCVISFFHFTAFIESKNPRQLANCRSFNIKEEETKGYQENSLRVERLNDHLLVPSHS